MNEGKTWTQRGHLPCFTFFVAWVFSFLCDPLLAISSFEMPTQGTFLGTAGLASACFALCSMRIQNFRTTLFGSACTCTVSVITCAGTLLLWGCRMGFCQMNAGIPIIAAFVCGIGAAWTLTGWTQLYSQFNLEFMAPLAFLSFAGAAILCAALSLLPSDFAKAAITCLLPLSNFSLKDVFVNSDVLKQRQPSSSYRRFKHVCIATPPYHACFMGYFAGMCFVGASSQTARILEMLVTALLFAVVSIYGLAIVRILKTNIIHRPVYILLSPLFVMLPFAFGEHGTASQLAATIGIILFSAILFVATADTARIMGFDAMSYATLRFALSGATLICGIYAALWINDMVGVNSIATRASLVIGALLLMAEPMITMENQTAIEEFLAFGRTEVTSISASEICEHLAQSHGLTPRETEVLKLLAQGRDPARIQDALVISYHTARNHIKSIYKKLGVHSRQDLVDLLEKQRSSDLEN